MPDRARLAAALVMVSAFGTVAGFVLGPSASLWARAGTFGVAVIPLGVLALVPSVSRALSRALALGASIAVLLLAFAFAPQTSTDVRNYAAYGRIVAEFDASPYEKAPVEYPDDPVTSRIPRRWEHTPSPYGPGFTAVSGVGM